MNLFPKTPPIFDELAKLTDVVCKAGRHLNAIKLGQPAAVKRVAAAVRDTETTADTICRTIAHQTDASFITPIDREDIHALKNDLNTIIDHIENVTTGIALYRVTRNGTTFNAFTTLIMRATDQVDTLIKELPHRDRHVTEMRERIAALHTIEKEGDVMIRKAYAKLFSGKTAPMTAIKWMKIFENLEIVLDSCEAVADRVDEIIIKNF